MLMAIQNMVAKLFGCAAKTEERLVQRNDAVNELEAKRTALHTRLADLRMAAKRTVQAEWSAPPQESSSGRRYVQTEPSTIEKEDAVRNEGAAIQAAISRAWGEADAAVRAYGNAVPESVLNRALADIEAAAQLPEDSMILACQPQDTQEPQQQAPEALTAG